MSESEMMDTSLSPQMKLFLTQISESEKAKINTFIAALGSEMSQLENQYVFTCQQGVFSTPSAYREYLGDSVYADFDGYNIVLQLDNGEGVHTQVALEPEVFDSLCDYVERLNRKLEKGPEEHVDPL